jgi:hypothetical protein
MADSGWSGKWEPNVVEGSTLEELKEHAGEPVMQKNGRLNEWCLVNLRTGELRYPARG